MTLLLWTARGILPQYLPLRETPLLLPYFCRAWLFFTAFLFSPLCTGLHLFTILMSTLFLSFLIPHPCIDMALLLSRRHYEFPSVIP
jgi:hypothetical protein